MAEFVVLAVLSLGIANQTTQATAIAPTAMCFSLIRAHLSSVVAIRAGAPRAGCTTGPGRGLPQ